MKSFLFLLSVCLLLAAVQAKSIFEQLEDEVMEFKSVDVDKKDKDDMNKDLKRDFDEILEMLTRDEKLGWNMLEELLSKFVKNIFHEVFVSLKKEGEKKEGFASGSGEGPSSGSGEGSSSGSGGSSGSGSEGSSSGSGGSSGSGSEGSSSGSGGSSGSGSEGSSSGSGQPGSAVPNNGPPVFISSFQQETL